MIIDTISIIGVVIVLGVLFAEIGKKPTFGIFSGLLLLILGIWLVMDSGIQIRTSETQLGTITNTTINTTTTYNYSNVPSTPGIQINSLLGMTFILVGLYMTFGYMYDVVTF